MNKLFTILTAVLMTTSVYLPQQVAAQAPEKISYQAVIRNSSDKLIMNTQVGMKISIRKLAGIFRPTIVYSETQKPTTNSNGLISIEIGGGVKVSGDFNDIKWESGQYDVLTECDPTGGTNYTITGSSDLQSVPYALHAKTIPSNMMPFAYGYVSLTGTFVSGTPNVGVITKVGIGQYKIEIAELGSNYIVVVTPNYGLAMLSGVVTGRTTGYFVVSMWDTVTNAYADAGFSFLIYKP